MKHIKYIFFAWIVIITNHVFSQQLRFKQITNEEGLSTNYVTSIMQDEKGFMWFGTQDGLNKYDGYNITIFKNDPTTQNSLSSSEITCLKQIKQDLIAVGTRDGINFFNPITLKFTRVNTVKGTKIKINTIAILNDDNLIAGTDEGLFSISISTNKITNYPFPIEGGVIVSCIKQVDNKFYVGTR